MKKIDLHLHTIKASDGESFDFDPNVLKKYVEKMKIDCIAITNHNLFDKEQFETISNELDIIVLPGIEIDLEGSHLLLISENNNLEDFAQKCKQVSDTITEDFSCITTKQLKEFFINLDNYLLIPHYDKNPIIKQSIIDNLKSYILVGEVSSPGKFKRCIKNPSSLIPVLFSDSRFSSEMKEFTSRQTFLDCERLSLKNIKISLLDRNKISLSDKNGHDFFQGFKDGQNLSMGLNVFLGERSSGKTFALKEIYKTYNENNNILFIKQFELVEKEEEKDIKKFNEKLSNSQGDVRESYLRKFKEVLEDVVDIDRDKDVLEIDLYLESLLKSAIEEGAKDKFAKAVLYDENNFIKNDIDSLKELINATELILEHEEYKKIIYKHILRKNLVSLFIDLVSEYKIEYELNLKKEWVNSLVMDIQNNLQFKSGCQHVENVDFYKIQMNRTKLNKFVDVCNLVKEEKNIEEKNIHRFKIVARVKKFDSAQELHDFSKGNLSFKKTYGKYTNPTEYLKELKEVGLNKADLYKFFAQVEYKILNENNCTVSGGERSEFRLLDKIQDARKYDMLLIDEPESSFDNLFLRKDVNNLIKDIAQSIPVLLTTHNNTIGASIKPDFIVYTKKYITKNKEKPLFKKFAGKPEDEQIKSIDGKIINTSKIMVDCLESGEPAYSERRKIYKK